MLILAIALFNIASTCGTDSNGGSSGFSSLLGHKGPFTIMSGSENKSLEPILAEFLSSKGYELQMTYMGSVDIMFELQSGQTGYDAAWSASRIWFTIGDPHGLVTKEKSIMTSPVALGLRKSVAQQLGFVNNAEVSFQDILTAAEKGTIKFMMTSATQSNSGATTYLSMWSAFAGNPEVLTMEHLNNPEIQQRVSKLLKEVSRSSASSGFLKDLFLKLAARPNPPYNAMFNYESMLIETNQELERMGQETLYVVYPKEGMVVSDSPLGLISKDPDKVEVFAQLQEHLLSSRTQRELLDAGRRTGFGGIIENPDKSVFNPAWGIDTDRILSSVNLPRAEVIQHALALYQGQLRKPSLTAMCLDFSGSMQGERIQDLKEAVSIIIDPEKSAKYYLQSTPQDKFFLMPFSHEMWDTLTLHGNQPTTAAKVIEQVKSLDPKGGTDIYRCAYSAVELLSKQDLEQFNALVILMTDGESATDNMQFFNNFWREKGHGIPVFPIRFGNADPVQLEGLAQLTDSRVFDGVKNLLDAMRNARGYN